MAHYLAGTGGASDLVSRLATLRRTMADTMSAATDSASRLYAGIRSAAETLSTSDAVSRVASWFRTIGETLSIQDSVQTAKSGANNYARAVTEALSNSDAVARAAAWLRSLTEGPQSYVNTISADSPIAWWRLDDTGTTAVDQIAAHNGTLNGGVTTGVAGATADGDAAMSFDGSTGYISIPDTAGNFNFSGTAPFSVEVWLYPTVASPTYWMRALTREQSSPRDGWELLAYKGTGASGFARYAAGTGDECTSGNTPLPLNHWNYCVGTYDGTNMRWYVNGVLLRTLASSRSISSLSLTLDIGAYSGGQLWNGGIDEVALYNYALSGSQVVTHYLAGAGGATDFVTRVVSVFRSITDTLSAASDGVARLYNGIRTATESLSVSDVVARLASYRRSIADTLSAATDSVSRIYAILRNATESVTASDAVSRLASWFRSPSEALSSSDAVARVAGFRGAAADTLSAATDSVAKLIGYVRTGAEALSTSDTVARLGAFGRGIADALGAAVDAVVGLFRTFANPGTVGAFDYPVYMVSAVDYAAAFVDAVDYATATVAALDSAVAPATPYATVILRDNPVGYWRLDDAGSTVVDQLGLYNGTLTGNVTEGVAGALPNDPDKAMEFGGTTGYIDMGNVLNFGTGSFTVEYWVNLVALPNNPKWHLGKGNPYADATAGWSVATWDTTNQAPIPACYISDGVSGHGTHANVPSGATRGTWAHIVFVIDRNAQLLRAAINGVESSGSNISGVGSVSSALPLRLGQGNGNPFWGGLDEVALYNYALSAEQIASHYAVGQQQAGSVGAFDYPVDTVQAADLN